MWDRFDNSSKKQNKDLNSSKISDFKEVREFKRQKKEKAPNWANKKKRGGRQTEEWEIEDSGANSDQMDITREADYEFSSFNKVRKQSKIMANH